MVLIKWKLLTAKNQVCCTISLTNLTSNTNPVKNPAERSVANIPFVTPSKELDAKFVAEATPLGFKNIKGHRSVGGMRASLYNAFPRQGVLDLIEFMKKFEAENKILFYYHFRIEFVIK